MFMRRKNYSIESGSSKSRVSFKNYKKYAIAVLALVLLIGVGAIIKGLAQSPAEKSVSKIKFDDTVSDIQKQTINNAIKEQSKTFSGSTTASVNTSLSTDNNSLVLSAYVPVTNMYAPKQTVAKDELSQSTLLVPKSADEKTRVALAQALGVESNTLKPIEDYKKLENTDIAFIPAGELSAEVKLLKFDDAYYLDSFQKGAVFQQASFTGNASDSLKDLKLNSLPAKETTLKINMTGVTALTRVMMKKLNSVGDPLYFSKYIGPFLADADITHTSNEVSFKENCSYSDAVFCAPPKMIEVLKDSGMDVIELTGNHNNDTSRDDNKSTIELYKSLGWHTFGGGINSEEAAKPYIADQKKSKVAFLGYNYPDSPTGGPIATSSSAGANSFDFNKIKKDIESAKQQSDFVIVDVQFWECYAYPNGYIEMPECYRPITDQKEVFRKIADLGANMVVGTQAHQPQTYEQHNGTPIYYGLGNIYFDQTQWPGTEKSIVLTHYMHSGKLLQTKLTPTVYNKDFQTRVMDDSEAVNLLEKLNDAR